MGPKLKSKKNDAIKEETPTGKRQDMEAKRAKTNREDKLDSGSRKAKRKIVGKKRIGKKDPPKLDAFQLLMDSRKKVIGDNATGKEIVSSDDNTDAFQQKRFKSQRKLFLEKWAEKKGGAKNKELDVAHSESINNQLKKRKKRLTKMLLHNAKGSEEVLTSDSCIVTDKISICAVDKANLNNGTSELVSEVKDGSKKFHRMLTKKKYDEDDDFLSKLSPSLKEKNMLRYFKKLDIIPIVETSLKQTVVKKNKIKVIKNKKDELKRVTNDDDVDKGINVHISKRIRKEVVYVESDSNSDSDVIVEDKVATTKKKFSKKSLSKTSVDVNKENMSNPFIKTVSPIKIVNIKSSNDMKCVRSPKIAVAEPPEKKMKIASLFLKPASKPLICPTVIEARQKFLYSESPKMIEKPIELIQNSISTIVWFPEISHVQQIPTTDDNAWNLPLFSNSNNLISDVLELEDEIKYEYFLRNDVKNSNDVQSDKTIYQIFDSFNYKNTKEGLRCMKKTYPNFPVYKYFRSMRDKCVNSQKHINNQDEGVLWTEKYKPMCSDDIVGNLKSINALKSWLSSWKECTKQAFVKLDTKKRRNSSSDDFFTSDSDSNDAIRLPNNVKIVVGPVGSGKTSTVYSIANELDLNVLEVNASSKRTGKRILTVLQEATQSHKVLTKNNSEDLPVVRLNGSKHKKLMKKYSEDASQNNDNKMSLMLIEDADIVFEEDDGFESALVQIVQTTKRPIIVVVSNIKCNSIKRIVGDNNVLKFSRLSGKFIAPWLDIMIFLESGLFVPQMSSHIIDSNGCDMRKSILQVQFCTSNYKNSNWTDSKDLKNEADSTIEEISHNDDSNTSWNESGETRFSYIKSELFDSLEQFSKSSVSLNINKFHEHLLCTINSSDSSNPEKIDSLSEMLDGLSMIDMMQSHNQHYNKNKIYSWSSKPSDSLSVNENDHEYKYYECLSSRWCRSFMDMSYIIIKRTNDHRTCDVHSILHSNKRWITKQHQIYSDLSEAVSLLGKLDRTSSALDYVSTLRNICRLEKYRSDTNLKRNNRFYHYLRSLGVDARDATFDEACDIIKPT